MTISATEVRGLYFTKPNPTHSNDRVNNSEAARELHAAYHRALERPESLFHVPNLSVATDEPAIDVFVYRPDARGRLLVTAGLSTAVQGSKSQPTHRPHVELYTRVPAELGHAQLEEACRGLWRLANTPFTGQRRPLSEWHTVKGIPPLGDGSLINAFLLTMPTDVDDALRQLGEELDVQFLHAYGLTKAEQRLASAMKPSALPRLAMSMFAQVGPYTDPLRSESNIDALVHS